MQASLLSRGLAGFVACVLTIALAPPSPAQPGAPVPGNGVFRVGPEIAPGTYQTQGPSTPLVLVFGDVAPISFCSWTTYSTPGTNKADIVDSNSSLGPMYAKVPASVATFETANCHPWTKVS